MDMLDLCPLAEETMALMSISSEQQDPSKNQIPRNRNYQNKNKHPREIRQIVTLKVSNPTSSHERTNTEASGDKHRSRHQELKLQQRSYFFQGAFFEDQTLPIPTDRAINLVPFSTNILPELPKWIKTRISKIGELSLFERYDL
jgi:lipopolysaccharide export LptBFGC system permease protein LptF